MSAVALSILAVFVGCLLFALVLGSWTERIRSATEPMNRSVSESRNGRVSHVVASRNAEATLVPLLQDLHAQDWPKELIEVIVVDDASSDGTGDIVRSMQRTWPQLHLCRNVGEGKKAAITTGVNVASGEFVVLTDADARCGRKRTTLIMEHMEAEGSDLLILPVHTMAGVGALGRLQEEEQAGLLGMAAGEALLGRPMLANGANMAFRKSAFGAVGEFKGDKLASGDDVFLVQRMREAGRRIGCLMDPRVTVVVQAERTCKGFLAQRLRWAGKMRSVRGLGPWVGLWGVILPWLLVWRTCTIRLLDLPKGFGPEMISLLALSWILWLVPVLMLVRQVRSFLGLSNAWPISAFAYLAFCIYSPLIALLALVVRPRWKGRRIS
ncbi:MAG: glycosyltransferase [Flavobacteriales bacterium]|nr:glycosyltransferase [Flavobacteriales bacterium]